MKSIPEVLDTFARYGDVSAAIQIRVPLDLDLTTVANRLKEDIDYRVSTFPSARLIFIPLAVGELDNRTPDCLERIKRRAREAIISRYMPSAHKESVKPFLDDLGACREGRAFAADCDSIAQIWDKMVREKRWDFLNYVVRSVRDSSKLYRRYVVNHDGWARVRDAYWYVNQHGSTEWHSLTEAALLSMNPFSR